ncbi:hypothetical protein C8R42DRAFT_721013 [Lentinula raphanica]|nr:hypothetical protein C8R42DRAFT_721013 [Lentinula raphanica]
MGKRKNSQSEKTSPSENQSSKRRKDKDTRDEDLDANGLSTKATSKATSKVTPKDSTSTASTLRSSSSNSKTSIKPTASAQKASIPSSSKASSSKASNSKSSSSKSSSSKPSKKEKTTKGKSLPDPAAHPSASAQKSSSLQQKKSTKPKDSQGTYMTTLDIVAPPKEEPKRRKDDFLDEDELKDLGGVSGVSRDRVILLMDEDRKKVKQGSDNDEDMLSEEESDGDVMTVKDVTQPVKQPKKKKSKSSKKGSSQSTKVLESHFEDPELARLGKSSVHMAICIDDMWPKEEEPNLDLFTEELGKMGNQELLKSLEKITSSPDPNEVKKLCTFMNYGSSGVRSDIAKIVRIMTAQYYNLSISKGEKAQEEVADRVRWLLANKKYHQVVDIDQRSFKGGPFSSPLIGMILRSYFVDSASHQNVFLIKHMKAERKVPAQLIIMITVLIEHAIREWHGGSKVKIHLTPANVQDYYRKLEGTMEKTKKRAETYAEDLEIDFFEEMMTYYLDEDDIPEYDYNTLEAEAKAKRAARRGLKKAQEEEEDGAGTYGSGSGSDSERSDDDDDGDRTSDDDKDNEDNDGKGKGDNDNVGDNFRSGSDNHGNNANGSDMEINSKVGEDNSIHMVGLDDHDDRGDRGDRGDRDDKGMEEEGSYRNKGKGKEPEGRGE